MEKGQDINIKWSLEELIPTLINDIDCFKTSMEEEINADIVAIAREL